MPINSFLVWYRDTFIFTKVNRAIQLYGFTLCLPFNFFCNVLYDPTGVLYVVPIVLTCYLTSSFQNNYKRSTIIKIIITVLLTTLNRLQQHYFVPGNADSEEFKFACTHCIGNNNFRKMNSLGNNNFRSL